MSNRFDTSYYSAEVADFLVADPNAILGALAGASVFNPILTQIAAWTEQIVVLKAALVGIPGTIFFEFNVPRIGSRIDVVLISGPNIFVIEFKVGEKKFNTADINQVWDYALDLKNFHRGSHSAAIFPILVATEASGGNSKVKVSEPHVDYVFAPALSNSQNLGALIGTYIASSARDPNLDAIGWSKSPYHPTPTIIEAAQALYSKHSVEDLARHDAGARNLAITSEAVERLIDQARESLSKKIVFVTGVPGAGKTLVGLNVATRRYDKGETHAVFLSGNAPLVAVLSEALARDEMLRAKSEGRKCRKGDVRQKIKAFIQNIHHFRDAGVRDVDAPSDHVVIFDEAQRAWDLRKTADFMKKRKGIADFNRSESEFLISYMDRHDWAVIICLVGGGQEINTGEAGISAWLAAIQAKFPNWDVHISAELGDSEFRAGDALAALADRPNTHFDESLHLAVSMRSFRAEHVSTFVKSVLDCEVAGAKAALTSLLEKYPIAVTRDLDLAKQWIRQRARGSERFGLVASSGALRLRPHAVDVRVKTDPVHWFLNDRSDVRSSFYMEDAATEFQVQGLELDWVCVNWDADLRFSSSDWEYRSFAGSKWSCVNLASRQQYLKNAYRVILTRARQGMVIFVPPGDSKDHTRKPEFYDRTFRYLAQIGIPVLQ